MEGCDIPAKTFQHALDYIVGEIKPDIIFWTGDNSAHDTWETTSDEVLKYTFKLTHMLKSAVKDRNIAVVPVLGNHDTWLVEEQSFS